MKIQVCLFLIILPYCLTFKCSQNDPKCFCIESSEYEFQCPSMDNMKTLIHSRQGSYVQIDCEDLTTYDLNYLPDYPAGDNIDFLIRRCPLHTDALTLTMNHFNVSRLKSLRLEEVWITGASQNISKDLFKDLQTLQMLELKYLNVTIQDDFLEYLPELKRLYLEKNHIQNLNFKFKYSPKLTVLHLSQNNIVSIPDYALKDLVNMKQLHLWSNQLKSLTKASFSGLTQITSLELSRNRLEDLDEEVFANMPHLVNISLLANNLSNISANLFKHNRKLEGIKLGFNKRLVIPDGLFSNLDNVLDLSLEGALLEEIPAVTLSALRNLRKLNLGSNKFKEIPGGRPFGAFQKLEFINLSNNEISKLTVSAFDGATSLKTILLTRNKIKTIPNYTFFSLKNLVHLDISFNQLALVDQSALLAVNLEKLILRNNLVESFPDQIVLNNIRLKELDLSYNRISIVDVDNLRASTVALEINLSNNNITEVVFENIYLTRSPSGTIPKAVVTLTNNNFICDCRVYNLLRYAHQEIEYDSVELLLDDVRCSQPEEWKGVPITNLKPSQIVCEKEENDYCPDNCSCIYRPHDATYVVDCNNRQLSACPILYGNYSYFRIEVNLYGNLIESGPDENMGYDKVIHLDLSHNLVREFDWVPPNIEILNLDKNRLSSLPINTIERLQKAVHLKELSLSKNPWRCDCSAAELQNFLKTKYQKVNISTVICDEDNEPLIKKQELCASSMLILEIVLPVVIIFLILVIVYMRYKHYIKVWLFSKNLCMWLVSEDEVDKNKKYDVFISYAHQDEDFVLTKLLPQLESGPTPFRTCIHIRDWMPGEMITTQVQRSVLDSRRTLVVLSNNFLESCWGRLEFKTAHVTAIKDNCSRVIVVKYGDLDEKKLDDDLRSYLKTNTYVEWGGPWFWKKLYYALPHRQTSRYQESLKHTNIMLKIDDKFELRAEPITVPDSTPPVLGADAAKLRNKLVFVPSESPLINR